MKKVTTSFFTILILLSFTSDNPTIVAKRFIEQINLGNFTEAAALTTDDFEAEYTYQSRKKSKKDYFIAMQNKIALHPVIRILESEFERNQVICLVENSTDFNTYLNTPKTLLNYRFSFRANQISHISIDSLEGYSKTIKQQNEKWNSFETWIKDSYPELVDTFKRNPYGSYTTSMLKAYSETK